MTAAVLRSSPNLGVPQTQNTAPVYEFNCLYTHDLRRKQKRWQDGFLRYHTFNKRVMVYDVPRNFLGDLHWTSGDDLQEGDEMTLEKGGIMVQVAERVGQTETDISGLLQRKDKTPAKTPASSRMMVRAQTPHGVASSITSRIPIGTAQVPMKHKSLNALLGGNARRPLGKASLPAESPFDIRNRDQESPRPSKRQKIDARNMAVQTPKAAHSRHSSTQKEGTTSGKHSDSVISKPNRLEVIDISSDVEDPTHGPAIEAELLSTSSPARFLESPAHTRRRLENSGPLEKRPIPVERTVVGSPSVRVQNRGRTDVLPPSAAAQELKESDPPKDAQMVAPRKPTNDDHSLQRNGSFSADSESQKRGKSLKLVSGAPRKMLVFQSQKSQPASSAAVLEKIVTRVDTMKNAVPQQRPQRLAQGPAETTFRQKLEGRLAHIDQRKRAVLQRSSSDVSEQRPVRQKVAAGTGLRKTNSVVLPRPEREVQSEEILGPDFPLSDISLSDVEDPGVNLRAPQPAPNNQRAPLKPESRSKAGAVGNKAKPFKPLTVKPKPPPAEEKKTDWESGPWSKEAFDLMDWRPPNKDTGSKEA